MTPVRLVITRNALSVASRAHLGICMKSREMSLIEIAQILRQVVLRQRDTIREK
jgi:hypothetical protein